MIMMLGLFLEFIIEKFGANLEKDIISHLSTLYYTLGWSICDSDTKMHVVHLYLRYTYSYVWFSGWRNVVRLHTANRISP